MRRAAWLVAAIVIGCSAPPPEEAPPAPAPVAAPAPAPMDDPAARRAKYDARPTVDMPAIIPPAWKTFVKALDGRLTGVAHEVRSSRSRSPWRSVGVTVRLFGLDGQVREAVRAALDGLDLPGMPPKPAPDGFWQGERVEHGDTRWSVDIGRLVAPMGSRREHIVTLKWQRTPPAPAEPRDCRKPPEIEPPAGTPRWLARPTSKRSTRRRITAAFRTDKKGAVVAMRMLFRNGYAHDEHVGHLTEAATAAGLTHASGSGPRQRWTRPDGASLSFEPDNTADLSIGCTLAGPVIAIEWRTPPPERSSKKNR